MKLHFPPFPLCDTMKKKNNQKIKEKLVVYQCQDVSPVNCLNATLVSVCRLMKCQHHFGGWK